MGSLSSLPQRLSVTFHSTVSLSRGGGGSRGRGFLQPPLLAWRDGLDDTKAAAAPCWPLVVLQLQDDKPAQAERGGAAGLPELPRGRGWGAAALTFCGGPETGYEAWRGPPESALFGAGCPRTRGGLGSRAASPASSPRSFPQRRVSPNLFVRSYHVQGAVLGAAGNPETNRIFLSPRRDENAARRPTHPREHPSQTRERAPRPGR